MMAVTSRLSTPARSSRGSALIVVVMLLAAIGVLLASLLAGVNRTMAREHAAWREQTARALAEAGIQRAAAQLAERGGAYSGEKDTLLGEGYYTTKIVRGIGSNEFTITSIARLRDGAHVLRRCELTAKAVIDGKRIVSLEYIDPRTDPRSPT